MRYIFGKRVSHEISEKIRKNWEKLGKSGKNWENLGKFGIFDLGQIWKDLGIFEEFVLMFCSCLAEDSIILNILGGYLPFEVAVGINGRIWVKSTTISNTIILSNAILNSHHMTKEQMQVMVQSLVKQNKASNR